MGGWWVAELWSIQNGPVIVVSWLVWVIVSIVLHELAHGWMALRLGDETPRLSGHMTWNPLVHMGAYSLAALAIFGIAWGAMPVDPSRLKGKHADTYVTLAGPAMNLALAIVATILYALWVPIADGQLSSGLVVQEPLRTNLEIFLRSGAWLNVALMLFNLLPVPPLDGGRVLMNLSTGFRNMMRSENGQWVALGMFVIVFVFVASYLFMASMFVVEFSAIVIRGLLFP